MGGHSYTRGPNATEEFVRRLDKELRKINDVLEVKVERIVTEEAKRNSLKQLVVGYLQIEAWKTPIPVVFHNFRGYDSHLVCESVGQSIGAHQIKVIAETFERYKSMKVGQFKYIDSMQFMASSLANLAKEFRDR
ncbi:unnamed protein product [Rhizophagus irregularis]|nr:unnamed protein product [Rhizophagus irregularis]